MATSDLVTPAVKNTHQVNLVTPYAVHDDRFLRRLLDWLRDRCVKPVSEEEIDRHLAELTSRIRGGRSLVEVAAATGEPLRWLQTIPTLFRYYGFARYDLGGLVVSVDILDATRDLGMTESWNGLTVEVFGVASDRGSMGERLAQLATELTDLPDVDFAFGGYSAFLARYAGAQHKQQPLLEREWRPWGFLWPLTYFKGRIEPAEDLQRLPVYAVEQRANGLLVQVFKDLWNGDEGDYMKAAQALDLASVWELDVPGRR